MQNNSNSKGKAQRAKCYKLLKVLDSYDQENKLVNAAVNFGKKNSLKLAISQTIKVLLQRYGVELAKQVGRKAGIAIDLLWPSDSADSTIEGGFLLELDHLYKELENNELNSKKAETIAKSIKSQAQKMIASKYYGDAKECYEALNKIIQIMDNLIIQLSSQTLT
jgi:hypothetical protein